MAQSAQVHVCHRWVLTLTKGSNIGLGEVSERDSANLESE